MEESKTWEEEKKKALEESKLKEIEKTTVTFTANVDKDIVDGKSICIVGSIPELGSWSALDAVMTEKDPNSWTLSVSSIPKDVVFEYKYVITDNANNVQWENGENHQLNLLDTKEKTFNVNDSPYLIQE